MTFSWSNSLSLPLISLLCFCHGQPVALARSQWNPLPPILGAGDHIQNILCSVLQRSPERRESIGLNTVPLVTPGLLEEAPVDSAGIVVNEHDARVFFR